MNSKIRIVCPLWEIILSLCFILFCSFPGLSAEWPVVELVAEAGIVMDVDTGAVLFEKNGDVLEYPASITKVMTALTVLKYCSLDDEVLFSYDAVYNVDKGSSNAQIEAGDVLTVSDCLYALLLKSANEAANALAEHVSGSRTAFAELMNQEAQKLGCTGTHFSNPSGLYADDHFTTARDMALIGAAAMDNASFLEIESNRVHTLAPTIRVPEGNTIYMEHKMLLQSSPYYDTRVIAGKTGYTIACGNTLLTLAVSNGRRLVAVVLKDKTPYHYTDTRALLDLGFGLTENQLVQDKVPSAGELRDRMVTDTVVHENCREEDFHMPAEQFVSLPMGSSQEGLSWELQYNLPENLSNSNYIAEIMYYMDGRNVGHAYVEKEQSIQVAEEKPAEEPDTPVTEGQTDAPIEVSLETLANTVSVNWKVILISLGALMLAAVTFMIGKKIHDGKERERQRKERRRERLQELSMTEEDFLLLVEKNREDKRKGREMSMDNDGEASGDDLSASENQDEGPLNEES